MLPRWVGLVVASAALAGCAVTEPERPQAAPQAPAAGATSQEAKPPEASRRAQPAPQPREAAAADAPTTAPANPPPASADAPQDLRELSRGTASWYGRRFHGRRTASGEIFDMNSLTAAHRSLPFGTVVRVRSMVNGREVDVRINDRGPHLPGRIIDLSRAAAEALGLRDVGLKEVALSVAQDLAAPPEAAPAEAAASPPRAAKPKKRKPAVRPRPAP